MTASTSRLFALFAVLVGVWIIAYWVYEPSGRPGFPRDATAPALASAPALTPPAPAATPDRFASQPGAVDPAREHPSMQTAPDLRASVEAPPITMEKRTRIQPPEFREVLVQRGDNSWQRIAKRELGDASLWPAVARSNPLLTSDRLKPGRTRVKIPLDPSNTQGKLVEVLVPAERAGTLNAGAPDPAQAPAAEPAQAGRTYTIAPYDTLWSIAKKHYGRGAAWPIIHEANRSAIPDPDKPPIGATIMIPDAPPAGDAARI